MSSVWPPMVTRTTTSPDVHATEPAAEMLCGDRIHDSASDWVRSRSIVRGSHRAPRAPRPRRCPTGTRLDRRQTAPWPRRSLDIGEKERDGPIGGDARLQVRSEEHTSELQSPMY